MRGTRGTKGNDSLVSTDIVIDRGDLPMGSSELPGGCDISFEVGDSERQARRLTITTVSIRVVREVEMSGGSSD